MCPVCTDPDSDADPDPDRETDPDSDADPDSDSDADPVPDPDSTFPRKRDTQLCAVTVRSATYSAASPSRGRRSSSASRGDVGQPDHVLADAVRGDEAQRRPRAGEVRLAAAEHVGPEVEPVLVDQRRYGGRKLGPGDVVRASVTSDQRCRLGVGTSAPTRFLSTRARSNFEIEAGLVGVASCRYADIRFREVPDAYSPLPRVIHCALCPCEVRSEALVR